jgi:DNA-binding NarL/FixJ family response regulator
VDTVDTSLSDRRSLAIADDHPIVLEGLKRLLADEFDIRATACNGRDLIDAARRIRPDVIVTDLVMPDMDGIEVTRRLRKEGVSSRVVVLTMHDEPERAVDAFAAGAAGYVLKGSTGEELSRAIQEVLSGRTYLSPAIALGVLSGLMEERAPVGAKTEGELTRRQRQVLRLVAEGHSLKSMARILGISRRTVESHKYELMRKLNVTTTAEVVLIAMRMRVIPSPLAVNQEPT